jgi:hypothetical protein
MLRTETLQPLPAIFVGKDKINTRVKLYQQNKHPLLSEALSNGGVPRQDTKSIWYSREHVETWLNEMNQMDASGIRIYFGAYEAEAELAAGQLCLLMVLTRAGANANSHKDIILENEPDFEGRLQLAQSRAIETETGLPAGTPREYNYGSPCPPICPYDEPGFPTD